MAMETGEHVNQADREGALPKSLETYLRLGQLIKTSPREAARALIGQTVPSLIDKLFPREQNPKEVGFSLQALLKAVIGTNGQDAEALGEVIDCLAVLRTVSLNAQGETGEAGQLLATVNQQRIDRGIEPMEYVVIGTETHLGQTIWNIRRKTPAGLQTIISLGKSNGNLRWRSDIGPVAAFLSQAETSNKPFLVTSPRRQATPEQMIDELKARLEHGLIRPVQSPSKRKEVIERPSSRQEPSPVRAVEPPPQQKPVVDVAEEKPRILPGRETLQALSREERLDLVAEKLHEQVAPLIKIFNSTSLPEGLSKESRLTRAAILQAGDQVIEQIRKEAGDLINRDLMYKLAIMYREGLKDAIFTARPKDLDTPAKKETLQALESVINNAGYDVHLDHTDIYNYFEEIEEDNFRELNRNRSVNEFIDTIFPQDRRISSEQTFCGRAIIRRFCELPINKELRKHLQMRLESDEDQTIGQVMKEESSRAAELPVLTRENVADRYPRGKPQDLMDRRRTELGLYGPGDDEEFPTLDATDTGIHQGATADITGERIKPLESGEIVPRESRVSRKEPNDQERAKIFRVLLKESNVSNFESECERVKKRLEKRISDKESTLRVNKNGCYNMQDYRFIQRLEEELLLWKIGLAVLKKGRLNPQSNAIKDYYEKLLITSGQQAATMRQELPSIPKKFSGKVYKKDRIMIGRMRERLVEQRRILEAVAARNFSQESILAYLIAQQARWEGLKSDRGFSTMANTLMRYYLKRV